VTEHITPLQIASRHKRLFFKTSPLEQTEFCGKTGISKYINAVSTGSTDFANTFCF